MLPAPTSPSPGDLHQSQMTTGGASVARDHQTVIASRQASEHTSAIGQSVPRDVIDKVREYLENASPPPIYKAHSEIPFIYEVLEKEEWRSSVMTVIQPWVENQANLQRAATRVGRAVEETDFSSVVCGFCIFRLKEFVTKEAESILWISTSKDDGLGIHLEHSETVVFIALEDLGPSNGFFMPLKRGQDVCVDSKADIPFPATGGGMGICLVLRI